MAPKFRGGSDDWLDNQKQFKKKAPATKKPRAEALAPELANAIVAEIFPKQARVLLDSDGKSVVCNYRRNGVFGHSGTDEEDVRERSPVCVGDRVLAGQLTGTDGVVEGVAVRRNRLLRPAPDRGETTVHVIAANLDGLVIVASAANPEFSPGLVDRFMVAAAAQEIPVILCINKIDLAPAGARPWQLYQDLATELDCQVIEVSAKAQRGVDEFHAQVKMGTHVFCGHSGVGKTSLLRVLAGREVGRIGAVSDSTGKGRHTTTGAIIVRKEAEGTWIDTPGVREFGLRDVDPNDLIQYFPDLAPARMGCTSEDCRHEDAEAGCRAEGQPRYASYRRILTSLRSGEH